MKVTRLGANDDQQRRRMYVTRATFDAFHLKKFCGVEHEAFRPIPGRLVKPEAKTAIKITPYQVLLRLHGSTVVFEYATPIIGVILHDTASGSHTSIDEGQSIFVKNLEGNLGYRIRSLVHTSLETSHRFEINMVGGTDRIHMQAELRVVALKIEIFSSQPPCAILETTRDKTSGDFRGELRYL